MPNETVGGFSVDGAEVRFAVDDSCLDTVSVSGRPRWRPSNHESGKGGYRALMFAGGLERIVENF